MPGVARQLAAEGAAVLQSAAFRDRAGGSNGSWLPEGTGSPALPFMGILASLTIR